jgi:hypothetical protein
VVTGMVISLILGWFLLLYRILLELFCISTESPIYFPTSVQIFLLVNWLGFHILEIGNVCIEDFKKTFFQVF